MIAQMTSELPYGAVVRYASTPGARPIQAVVDHMEPDAIIMTIAGTHDFVRVRMADLTGLEIRRRTTAALPGLAVGALIGAAVGAQFASSSPQPPPSPCDQLVCFDGEQLGERLMEGVLYVAMGSGVGAALGAAVGAQFKHDRWLPVSFGSVGPVLGAGPTGSVTLGLTLRF